MTEQQAVVLKGRFLDAFAACGNVSAACRTADVHRSAIYAWREHDDAFAAAYRLAEIESIDALEAEARRRALVGVTEPVFYKGSEVGEVQKFSDVLLIFLLKGARPEKYRERYELPAAGTDGGPVRVEVVYADEPITP